MDKRADAANIWIEFGETCDGVSTWYVELDGETVGDFTREHSTKWADGARRGLVADRAAPMFYTVTFWDAGPLAGLSVDIADGANLRLAKKLIIAAAAEAFAAAVD